MVALLSEIEGEDGELPLDKLASLSAEDVSDIAAAMEICKRAGLKVFEVESRANESGARGENAGRPSQARQSGARDSGGGTGFEVRPDEWREEASVEGEHAFLLHRSSQDKDCAAAIEARIRLPPRLIVASEERFSASMRQR